MKRQRRRIVMSFSMSVIIGLALFAICVMTGCRTTVTGGQTQHLTHGADVRVETAGGTVLTYHDDGERQATTQPTVFTNSGALPKLGQAVEGQIGSVSFEQAKKNFPNAWPVALIFLAAAAGLWFLAGNRLAAIACAGCAILTLLFPQIMVFFAIAAVVLFIWSVWGRLRDLIRGNQAALLAMDPDDRAKVKSTMETKHDAATKRVVAGLKG